MKNLISVSPLRIVLKSNSGLAVLVLDKDEFRRYQIGLGIRVKPSPLSGLGKWIPLSQVVCKNGYVVAVSGWLIKAKGLPLCTEQEVGVW